MGWSRKVFTLSDSGKAICIVRRVMRPEPLVWKPQKGYFRRSRDLGQVVTAERDFTPSAVMLRTGNDSLAFLPGAAGAEMFVQFFEVTGEPLIDDNGTPPGTDATHGFSTNHRCDDFVRGVDYRPLRVVRGGRMPDLLAEGDGRLTYLKFAFAEGAAPRFEKGRRYAFMVGFVEPAEGRNFTLSNRNLAYLPDAPTLDGPQDNYHGGWGLRREGDGTNPPLRRPGAEPPSDAAEAAAVRSQATFPPGAARYAVEPRCEGYPDVDTYRDLEFYLLAR